MHQDLRRARELAMGDLDICDVPIISRYLSSQVSVRIDYCWHPIAKGFLEEAWIKSFSDVRMVPVVRNMTS